MAEKIQVGNKQIFDYDYPETKVIHRHQKGAGGRGNSFSDTAYKNTDTLEQWSENVWKCQGSRERHERKGLRSACTCRRQRDHDWGEDARNAWLAASEGKGGQRMPCSEPKRGSRITSGNHNHALLQREVTLHISKNTGRIKGEKQHDRVKEKSQLYLNGHASQQKNLSKTFI